MHPRSLSNAVGTLDGLLLLGDVPDGVHEIHSSGRGKVNSVGSLVGLHDDDANLLGRVECDDRLRPLLWCL